MILLLLLQTMPGCVEEYWPPLEKYENLMVVDGMITNLPGPYTITLSISTDLNNPRLIPVRGASVIIRDQSGNYEALTEKLEGVYETAADGLQGVIGESYRAEITTAEGTTFLSDYRELKKPVEIDTVYPLTEYIPVEDSWHDISGYKFYIDTKQAESDTNYLIWDLWATYEYETDFKIRYMYDGELREFPKSDSLKTCWKTEKVKQIFTAGTGGLTTPLITKYPLHYVTTETKELSIRYSLLVKQWTVGKEDYVFWDQVKKQNEEQGGMYAYQPYQIRGNMFNPEDPEEPVLGNFTVAGIDENRIFVDRPGHLIMYYFKCELSDSDIENFSTIYFYPPESWPIYVTRALNGALALPAQECMDCRLSGGSITKPDFWVDY